MNDDSWKLAENLIPATYIKQARDASKSRENTIRCLIQHKKLPNNGWDDATIEIFLHNLSSMDSNNFPANCGVGEREGRFASALVARRHYNFGHGIGRSGDLTEPQPKAAGSSLLYKLTNHMIQDLMKIVGIDSPVECLLVPVATGMSLVISMITLGKLRPNAKYVVWSRIDQKSCFKSILSAGFIPIIIDTMTVGDELITNLPEVEESILKIGCDNIVCVMSTTSCFAPRACDDVENIARLCKKYQIPHLINNAYGLQSKFIAKRIQKAYRNGNVDIFVQSTDKNIMVPVGGAIIASFDKNIIECISKIYPGRASASPVLDAFITLLSLGRSGYISLMGERIKMFEYLFRKLQTIAEEFDEKVLITPNNPISIGFTLRNIRKHELTKLGSMLFLRSVSGTRVITTFESKLISKYEFKGWGSHCNSYPVSYLTAAASIGMKETDIDLFVNRLHKVLSQLRTNQDAVQTNNLNKN